MKFLIIIIIIVQITNNKDIFYIPVTFKNIRIFTTNIKYLIERRNILLVYNYLEIANFIKQKDVKPRYYNPKIMG